MVSWYQREGKDSITLHQRAEKIPGSDFSECLIGWAWFVKRFANLEVLLCLLKLFLSLSPCSPP